MRNEHKSLEMHKGKWNCFTLQHWYSVIRPSQDSIISVSFDLLHGSAKHSALWSHTSIKCSHKMTTIHACSSSLRGVLSARETPSCNRWTKPYTDKGIIYSQQLWYISPQESPNKTRRSKLPNTKEKIPVMNTHKPPSICYKFLNPVMEIKRFDHRTKVKARSKRQNLQTASQLCTKQVGTGEINQIIESLLKVKVQRITKTY